MHGIVKLEKLTITGLLLISLSGLFFSSGCSTKKNTFTRRVYHNLTSHFNVYWNGMDNLRQGVKEFMPTVKDNFSVVLPVYNYGDKAGSTKINQYADIGIAKASKAIQKHSMEFNKKEYVRWIDDSYMLIGESYYYKQDYGMARRTFEFVIKTYNTNLIKYEAMWWFAMSNVQLKDFKRAEPVLDMLQSKIRQGEAPVTIECPLNLAYAQFYILQKNYSAAVPYLEHALELNPPGEMKTRCMFILGQIRQMNGEYAPASSMYKSVIKRNAVYDMEFNAKINLAQCYDTQSGDKAFIENKLRKMLKDDKNKDFLDQVYYALAQVSLRDGDTITGIGYLIKSVATSVTNNYQKAISSLALADIYFKIPDYQLSHAYYDSTMMFLPKDYPNFLEIQRKTATLTDLVTNLQIIQREDSLQALASLSDEERIRIIDGIINQLMLDEQKKKIEELERQQNQNLSLNQQTMQSVAGPREGNWYFYNTAALSNGYSTFAKKWGRRKLEDLWFLSDKNIISFEDLTLTDTTSMPGDTTFKINMARASNPKNREYYLKSIPLTPELLETSQNRIIDAYYNCGFIYIDGLKDYKHSIESFESLLERYPGNRHEIPSCYELYVLYKDLENQPKSDYFRNLILTQYPETDYAKLLINPDYYKEILAKKTQATKLYEETWLAFNNQQFYMVLRNADQARLSYSHDTLLMPRFEYLRALALGKIEIEDSLVAAMQYLIQKYPKSEVRPLAINVLDYLSKQRNVQGLPLIPDSTNSGDPALKLYTYYPKSIHFYVLIVDGSQIDESVLKIKISDFNSKYFNLDNLQVNSLLLDNQREMITISNFYDGQHAMDYYHSIKGSDYVFKRLENTGGYLDFVISVENYPVFYRNKNTDLYQRFFVFNYSP